MGRELLNDCNCYFWMFFFLSFISRVRLFLFFVQSSEEQNALKCIAIEFNQVDKFYWDLLLALNFKTRHCFRRQKLSSRVIFRVFFCFFIFLNNELTNSAPITSFDAVSVWFFFPLSEWEMHIKWCFICCSNAHSLNMAHIEIIHAFLLSGFVFDLWLVLSLCWFCSMWCPIATQLWFVNTQNVVIWD